MLPASLRLMGEKESTPPSPLDFDYFIQWPTTVYSWSAGIVTFPACLGLFQVLLFRPLQLTCATFGAPLFGFGSVAVAGVAASAGLMGTAAYLHNFGGYTVEAVTTHLDMQHLVFNSVASAAWYYLLGGRFHSVLPSSLLSPGAFAHKGVTASFNYASNEKKRKLNQQGKRLGCHTCGRRWFVDKYIADHQPPLSVIRDMMQRRHYILWIIPVGQKIPKQRFYPQCSGCSKKQMSYLSAVNRIRVSKWKIRWQYIVTHATTLRHCYLWLPVPFLIHTLEKLKLFSV